MIKTVVTVDGMMCGMCESHINDAIRREFQVKKVSSHRKSGKTVIISKEAPDPEKLRAVIDATGYRTVGITSEHYEKKGLFFGSDKTPG